MPEKTNNTKYNYGEKIRTIREKKQMTLKEVALKAEVSESLVSQIERNKVSPAIDTLLRLADVLEIDLEYLFQDYKKKKKINLVKAGERNKIINQGILYEQLSKTIDDDKEHAIEAYYLEIAPDMEKGSKEYGHRGRELGIIIEGKGEFIIGGEKFDLEKGDSISFESDVPHILRNKGQKTLKAYWMVTPPKKAFGN
ncbi:MAG: helix-turn-helix transcriptional regulator [Spirochaetes bacterium]|nr:helix-turn-helix transcriptional regulator [Spirochaetota bacterium]